MRYLSLALAAIMVLSVATPSSADNLNNRARRIQRKAARLAADYPGVAVPSIVVAQPAANCAVAPPSVPVYPRRWSGYYGGSVPSGMIGFAEPGPVPYGGLSDYSAPIDYNSHLYGTARGYQGTIWPAPPAEAVWSNMPADEAEQPIEIEDMPTPAPTTSGSQRVSQPAAPAVEAPRPADDELLPETTEVGPRL